jgi:hypothetical protein
MRISLKIYLALFIVFALSASATFAGGRGGIIRVVKNDGSMWYGAASASCNSSFAFSTATFTIMSGMATAISQSPIAGNQVWCVNVQGNAYRLENNVWTNHDMYVYGLFKTASDIASYQNSSGTVSVWAVGQMYGNTNIYSFNNPTLTWTPVSGVGTRISICQTTGRPWVVNSAGDVYELPSSGWWIQRGYGSQQKAIDIGCGGISTNYNAVWIATDQGQLKRYTGGTSWTIDPDFSTTGKLAKAVSASLDIAAVVTTDNLLYFVKNNYYACAEHWAVQNSNISNVKDVTLYADDAMCTCN